VPAFADDKALVVFDGVCVLCSGFARFILERDRDFAFRLTTSAIPARPGALSPLRPRSENFETISCSPMAYPYAKLDTVAVVGARLGGAWRALVLLRGCQRAACRLALRPRRP
jgi:predicted DCC family thiol-disulfide oxidoreductase YuxK